MSDRPGSAVTDRYDLVVRSRRVLLPAGERPASVWVRAGRIAAIGGYADGDPGAAGVDVGVDVGLDVGLDVDLGEIALLPGLVDTHVHVNEPGRTEWEGFATATAAAAAGGVTTLVDMPLNSIPSTVDIQALETKRRCAAGQCHVDVGFWGGAVPGNAADLVPLAEAGVFGFKCFLVDSGVPEFAPVTREQLTDYLRRVPALFIVHAEDPAELATAPGSRRYGDFLASRPPRSEASAVGAVVAALAAAYPVNPGVRAHILHLSDGGGALERIARARDDGLPITAETCPHYLTLRADEVPDGATQFKCCPPIRDGANGDRLWRGLVDGVIDCVVSDHSPATPELKGLSHGDFATAWGGIASLQLGLPLMWTEACRRGVGLADVVRWMARTPADLVGLTGKGRIEVGADADLVAFDPDREFTVEAARLRHRHPVTPYAGRRLRGVVERTWVRGTVVDGVTPRGRLLERGSP
jgi:allantoinase